MEMVKTIAQPTRSKHFGVVFYNLGEFFGQPPWGEMGEYMFEKSTQNEKYMKRI